MLLDGYSEPYYLSSSIFACHPRGRNSTYVCMFYLGLTSWVEASMEPFTGLVEVAVDVAVRV